MRGKREKERDGVRRGRVWRRREEQWERKKGRDKEKERDKRKKGERANKRQKQ